MELLLAVDASTQNDNHASVQYTGYYLDEIREYSLYRKIA